MSMFTLLNSYGDTIAVFDSQNFILMGMCDEFERGGGTGASLVCEAQRGFL